MIFFISKKLFKNGQQNETWPLQGVITCKYYQHGLLNVVGDNTNNGTKGRYCQAELVEAFHTSNGLRRVQPDSKMRLRLCRVYSPANITSVEC